MNDAQPQEFLPVPDVAELLGTSLGKVRRLIEEHYLAVVRIDGIQKVPASFINGNEVVQGVRGTLILLLDAGFSSEQAVEWILAHSDDLGESPIAALRKGHKAPVRRAVQGLAF